jgi:hypothetical protein
MQSTLDYCILNEGFGKMTTQQLEKITEMYSILVPEVYKYNARGREALTKPTKPDYLAVVVPYKLAMKSGGSTSAAASSNSVSLEKFTEVDLERAEFSDLFDDERAALNTLKREFKLAEKTHKLAEKTYKTKIESLEAHVGKLQSIIDSYEEEEEEEEEEEDSEHLNDLDSPSLSALGANTSSCAMAVAIEVIEDDDEQRETIENHDKQQSETIENHEQQSETIENHDEQQLETIENRDEQSETIEAIITTKTTSIN